MLPSAFNNGSSYILKIGELVGVLQFDFNNYLKTLYLKSKIFL